jgi:ankyrin repeat protein
VNKNGINKYLLLKGDYELCKNLLAQNMDPNLKDYAGWSPLHEACSNGNLEIVQLLIENNADINLRGSKDSTPLHEAIVNNHLVCAKYLLEQGADINIKNSHGFLAKEFLIHEKKDCSLLKLIESIESNNASCNNKMIKSESLEDSFLNTTNVRAKRSAKAKQITIYSTGMSEEEKLKIIEIGKKLNFKLVREMSKNGLFIVFL